MVGVERINLKEAAMQIGYKDLRSFNRWCQINGVGIISDYGSKKRYVLKDEFESAKSKSSIEYLKTKSE